MERLDLQEIRALLDEHNYVAPIDARVYGLPKDDFDDQSALSIAERVFLRSWLPEQGWKLDTSGTTQYPHEAGLLLRNYLRQQGKLIDCSGFLADSSAVDVESLQRDGADVRTFQDTSVDNECHVVVKPGSPGVLVASSNPYTSSSDEIYRSSNWGKSWTHSSIPNPSGASGSCDPVSGWDSYGNAWHTTLGFCSGGIQIATFKSTDNGASWTEKAKTGTCGNGDKELLVIDSNPTSPCRDALYVGWHINGTQWVARSTNGATNWTTTNLGTTGTIGTDLTYDLAGTAYSCYLTTSTPGKIYLASSTNCGGTWTTKAIKTMKDSYDIGIPAFCNRRAFMYPTIDVDRQALSAFKNSIYIVHMDLDASGTEPGCNTWTGGRNSDVYFLRSTDGGTTFSTANLTGTSGANVDEFDPWMRVDQTDGSIFVAYHRTRLSPASITDRRYSGEYVIRSTDGGTTWSTPYKVSSGETCEASACLGADTGMQYGDYEGLDVSEGVVYPIWTDRADAADEDIFVAKVCSEPAHWSERAPTYTAPSVSVALGTGTNVNVSWTLPDLYWGDGGENAAARKFQLWVDGALAQDGIASTATSTAWTSPDCASHTFFVKALNSCGVEKVYGSKSIAVPPPAASGLAASTNDCDRITTSWTGVAGATGYRLFRGASCGAGSQIGTVTAPTVSYDDTTAAAGSTWVYWVVASFSSCGDSSASSCSTGTRLTIPATMNPNDLDLVPSSWSDLHLGWNSASDATGYDVYATGDPRANPWPHPNATNGVPAGWTKKNSSTVTGTSWDGLGLADDGNDYYFHVSPSNACGANNTQPR
jgi:hypothetical protein